ncbi:metalloprotease [Psychrobium sp. 1_MG-2023]|uniref:metalloprotease n=1 Tax=Psychrobium sp. 1_MG-2023 TaxID=3062624 RepID=UPI000C335C93|nr:site-2 protease family protein [Psychrobium sp. 1_MG-2023]MDP2560192.1 site-2 protease family protein [Psychrobium sp. 1_MG-2023]PKF57003.1 site-2 protease family protein [Alteromonadales bacterium alter-6D02]
MQLLTIDCLGKPLRLEGSMAGWQQLFWGDQCVSQIPASGDTPPTQSHEFQLESEQGIITVRLDVGLTWQPFSLDYHLTVNDDSLSQGQLTERDIEQRAVSGKPSTAAKFSLIGMAGLGLKLLKSAKVVKVLFAAGSLAAYSWLFSIEFAIALILCLVFHEYGHIRAMKYFGLKTKGIYLIPFVGGLALSDDKINTRWQDVVISIMGPFFGLILSVVSLIGYWITDLEILAGIAVFNALLNVFNLLPVLPLDGGHILKSIAFSINSKLGIIACVLGAVFGVYISYHFGLALLGFLLAIGSIEIFFEYKRRHMSELLPLDRYGQIVSTIWYILTLGGLSAIIWIVGQTDNGALSLPLKILGS